MCAAVLPDRGRAVDKWWLGHHDAKARQFARGPRRCDVARFERNERNKRNEPWPGPRVGMARRNKRQNRFPARGICYDARARPGPRSKIFSYNEKKSYGGRDKIGVGENPFLRIRRGKASGREFVLSMCAARLPRGA